MRTFNWFFGLGDESENKEPLAKSTVSHISSTEVSAESQREATVTAVKQDGAPIVASQGSNISQSVASAPSAAHRAKTGVFLAPLDGCDGKPVLAQQAPQSTSVPPVAVKKTAPATQVAYVASGSPVLPIASKAAIADAQAQLKGAVPVNLRTVGPTKPKSKTDSTSTGSRGNKLQTGLLTVTALAVLGAVVWSFVPPTALPPYRVDKPTATTTPRPHTVAIAPEHAEQESAAVLCVKDSTEYISSAVRDQLLLDAATAFEKGRLEQAQTLFEKYSSVSCDHATMQAGTILRKQLGARNPDQ